MKVKRIVLMTFEIIEGKWTLNGLTYSECSELRKSVFNNFFKFIKQDVSCI